MVEKLIKERKAGTGKNWKLTAQINRIRNLYSEGWSVANISRELEIDEKTARKYLAREDFSPKAPEKIVWPSRLDPFKT
jgi:transposase